MSEDLDVWTAEKDASPKILLPAKCRSVVTNICRIRYDVWIDIYLDAECQVDDGSNNGALAIVVSRPGLYNDLMSYWCFAIDHFLLLTC